MHWRRKWQPTPVFVPGESQGREAWWAAVYGVTQSRTRLKRCSSSSNSKPYLHYFKHYLTVVYNFLNFLCSKVWTFKSIFVNNISLYFILCVAFNQLVVSMLTCIIKRISKLTFISLCSEMIYIE